MCNYFIKSINFDSNGCIMYMEYCEDNKFYTYFPDQNGNGVDLFTENRSDIISILNSGDTTFSIKLMPEDILQETFTIKLPVNSDQLKGLNYYEKVDKINKIDHINLYIPEQDYNNTKHYFGWIMVELPEEIDGIKYIPIIIHRGLGVSVHPKYHKYFIRSFNKYERHLILGYLYLYGTNILFDANIAFKNNTEVSDLRVNSHQSIAFDYNDDDAPKRIDAGPSRTLSGGRYDDVIDDYKRWVKQNR